MYSASTPARDGRKMRMISSLSASLEHEIIGAEVDVLDQEEPGQLYQSTSLLAKLREGDAHHPPGAGKADAERVNVDPPIAGMLSFADRTTVPFVSSLFGAQKDAAGKMVWATPKWAEEELSNAGEVKGCIVLVWRGVPPGASMKCSFVDKTYRCIRGGAIGVIVVNNEDRALAPTGDISVDVPVVCIQKSEGLSLINGMHGSIEFDSKAIVPTRSVHSPGNEVGGPLWGKFREAMEASTAAIEMGNEAVEGKNFKRQMLLAAQREGLDFDKVAKIREAVTEALKESIEPLKVAAHTPHTLVLRAMMTHCTLHSVLLWWYEPVWKRRQKH